MASTTENINRVQAANLLGRNDADSNQIRNTENIEDEYRNNWTRCCSKKCISCVIVTSIAFFVIGSIFAFYLNRNNAPVQPESTVPNKLVHLMCYHCSLHDNVKDMSRIPHEDSCLTNPQNKVQCEPGDYCGSVYQEVFEKGAKALERACLKRPEILNSNEHICRKKEVGYVNHTICRCNTNLCNNKPF